MKAVCKRLYCQAIQPQPGQCRRSDAAGYETGRELDMGSPFDLFSPLSHPDCRDVTEEQYANRMLLQHVMVRNGFQPIDCEWWHFSLQDEPYPDTYFAFPVSSPYLKR